MHFVRRRTMNGAVVVTLAISAVCRAATLHVPTDYPTIQACIDAAVSGVDECVVAPGTYHETINFLGKAIVLRSSGGADVTTIDATGLNSSVVTCRNGEGPETILDGFTITGGTGTDIGGGYTGGGGMYNDQSSPTVTNCNFSGNTASIFGGGMYNNYFSSPTVTNCTFSWNMTEFNGGGMYNYYSSPTVSNCTFSGNSAYAGAGMNNDVQSRPTVTNCAFVGNTANAIGGGMNNDEQSHTTVTNCAFIGNTAHNGAALYNYYSGPTVTNSTFTANGANNCGGGIYSFYGSPTVTHCTFSGNTAMYSGAMLNNYYSIPTVGHCILWGNTTDEMVNDGASAPTVYFSDVQGGVPVGAIDGGGNINVDPMFVRPPNPGPDGTWDGVDDDYGDLRLLPSSPCIDAGDPGFVAQPGETDLDGHARVLCGQVDMGAYEFGVGDFDCDQTVDLIDFANWSACMTAPNPSPNPNPQTPDPCHAFDFDGDGDVDLRDFAGFQLAMNP